MYNSNWVYDGMKNISSDDYIDSLGFTSKTIESKHQLDEFYVERQIENRNIERLY